MGKLRSIQALRAIAVLAVVYCHAFKIPRGSSGVDLFFVISGFIIARVSHERSALDFAKARLWRIFPPYLIASAPYVAWQLIAARSGLSPKVLASLTLWPIWGGVYQEPVLPVAWSLYFEMLFYAGVTVWLIDRRFAFAGAALIGVSALLNPGPATAFLLSPIILEFACGYALASVRKFTMPTVALVVGLFLLFLHNRAFEGVTMLDPSQAGVRLLMFGAPAALTVYGGLGIERFMQGRWADLPVRIGDASYSIYLVHLMAVYGLREWPSAAKFAVAVILGLAFYVFVERRLIDWAGKRRRARAPLPGTGGPIGGPAPACQG
jgi:peptidoglycan/LPS O-acetylase OafA/YrhL